MGIPILRVRDENGNVYAIPAIRGETGPKGPKGDTGPAGSEGYTPVKGADYFTEADKTELVNDVLAALPAAEGVSY